MANRIRPGVSSHARHRDGDGTPEFDLAGRDGHHLNIGPGDPAISEWIDAGLQLPDLPAMRAYRLNRVRQQLRKMGYDGVVVMDPINIRYLTDTTNMQIWVMHNAARYAFVSVDGPLVMWDYAKTEFLSTHNSLIDEVRPAIGSTYFLAGPRYREQAQRWADDLADTIRSSCGDRPRIAIDQASREGFSALNAHGIELGSGQELMELARSIKGEDEILAMRCAVHACETTMGEMHGNTKPGMTEREVWAMLHVGNIKRAGEWIETQILSSGPRTNPWFQEASSRVIQDGEILAYDTDMVGAYGICVDVSRSFRIGGGKPTDEQARIHDLAKTQILRNTELMTVGRSFRELTFDSFIPPVERYRHYSCQYHGVGMCDEYPEIYFPEDWDSFGFDGALEAGMVLTVESYVGERHGAEGIKLENQVLISENGPELLTEFSLDLTTF